MNSIWTPCRLGCVYHGCSISGVIHLSVCEVIRLIVYRRSNAISALAMRLIEDRNSVDILRYTLCILPSSARPRGLVVGQADGQRGLGVCGDEHKSSRFRCEYRARKMVFPDVVGDYHGRPQREVMRQTDHGVRDGHGFRNVHAVRRRLLLFLPRKVER